MHSKKGIKKNLLWEKEKLELLLFKLDDCVICTSLAVPTEPPVRVDKFDFSGLVA